MIIAKKKQTSANIIKERFQEEEIIINYKNMSIDTENPAKREILKEEKEKIMRERDVAVSGYLIENNKEVGIDGKEAKDFEKITGEDAEKTVENLSKLHEIKTEDLPADVREKLNKREELQSFKGMSGDIFSMLEQDINGKPLYEVLQERLGLKEKPGVGNLKEQVRELIEQCRDVVEMSEGEKEFLVHGDLSLNNTHVDNNGEVKFSKWNWTASSKNEALALIYDFGNLRGRAADNPELQKALDKAIIDEFTKRGNSELGEAIVKMGTLRTSVKFLKYDAIKPEFDSKQRSSMEEDVKKVLK